MNEQNSLKGKKKQINVRTITGIGVLSAIAFLLQFIEVPIPIMPSFIKLDFSDLPELLGAFAYGPVAGVIISVIKNLVHLASSSSGGIGELSNCLLGAVFSFTAGMIYKRKKTKTAALLGGIIGAVVMGILSVPINAIIVYPLYYSVLGFPKEAVLSMYQVILPSVKSITEALFIFNLPFTIIKGLICVIVCFFIYKPLSPLFNGKRA